MSTSFLELAEERERKILAAMRAYTGRLTPNNMPFINLLSLKGNIDPPVTYEERNRLWPIAQPDYLERFASNQTEEEHGGLRQSPESLD